MPWKELKLEKWAKQKGIDLEELRQKEKLIKRIIRARKDLQLTQAELAKLVGVSQSLIVQIESRIKMDRITFDVLLNILQAMGFGYSISTRKVREAKLSSNAA